MQWKVSMIALIGLSVLCVTGCSSTRSVTADVRSLTSEVVRDTVREKVLVAVYDTLREVTTITVQQNEAGDTVFRSVVTDRDRVRERAAVKDKEEKVIVRTDTVYVAVRDSTDVRNYGATESQSGGTALNRTLKWIFWIVVAVIVLIGIVKFRV